jgi:hypothetical protein
MEVWHDFYLLIGGASASLVGLLFVGLSQHLRVVVTNPEVLRLARRTFLTFLSVVLVAAFALLPGQEPRALGTGLLVIGLVGVASVFPGAWKRTVNTAGAYGVFLATRVGVNVLGFLGLTAVGLALKVSSMAMLGWLAATVLILVATACYNSWDLLVTLGAAVEHRRQPAPDHVDATGVTSEPLVKAVDKG